MKIYWLVKCSGEWEDYREHVLKAYTKRETAETIKTNFEKNEQILRKQSKKCAKCNLFWNSVPDTIGYCEASSKVEWENGQVVSCPYQVEPYRDYINYRIDEIEVEE